MYQRYNHKHRDTIIHNFLLMRKNVQRLYKYRVKDSLEWWQLISEKRCDDYSHLQEDDYNEALKVFLQ